MIKVLHVTYDMRIGGTEMVIKNIIEGNSDSNIEMSIFCIEEPLGPWGKAMDSNGIKIASNARKPGVDTKLIKALRKHIKVNKIDVVHCHQYTPWVYGSIASAFTKARVIFTEHGRFYPDRSSWKRRIVNPLLLNLTSRVTAISNATKKALSTFEYIPLNKVEVIYNGIQQPNITQKSVTQLKQEWNISEEKLVIGTIARFDPIKNHQMILEGLHKLKDKFDEVELLMVGDGETRNELEALTKALSLSERVKFTGYQKEPKNFLAAMDVFLLPSFSEGTSMTLLEAMSIGKPTLVSNVGGNPEIVKGGKTGLICENNDVLGFTEKLEKLLANKDFRYELGKAGKQRYLSKFSNHIMVTRYSVIYREIVL